MTSMYLATHLTESQVMIGLIITGTIFAVSLIGLVYCSIMLILGRK